MAAKVKWDRDAWWVITHYEGKRRKKRVGPKKADKREAEQIAKQINARLALGEFQPHSALRADPVPCDLELRQWLVTYSATLKPSTRYEADRVIEVHLVPHFGSLDLRDIGESELLAYVQAKSAAGLAPATIRNHLSILRRVASLLHRAGKLARNPVSGIGELLRRVERASAAEVREVAYWTQQEASVLLGVARQTEPEFAPLLATLFGTGMRKGEALGLHWPDVNFEAREITIRRSLGKHGIFTPKSGRARRVPITVSVAEELRELLGRRRRQALERGWPEIPAFLFCSKVGGAPDPGNVQRVWARVRRSAHKQGVRPLRLHAARHSYATWALEAGRSVRWVADVLGHADPSLTLRTYTHAMRTQEDDLSFAELVVGDPKRPYTAPAHGGDDEVRDSATNSSADSRASVVTPVRFERTTSSFGGWRSIQLSYGATSQTHLDGCDRAPELGGRS